MVASLDGKQLLRAFAEGQEPEEIGNNAAEHLIAQGAKAILDQIRVPS